MRMIRTAMILPLLSAGVVAADTFSTQCFSPERREAQAAYERSLNEAASTHSLRGFHDLLASEPHIAGTPGDLRTIDRIASEFRKAGLEVETHWIWPYLSHPIAAELEIISPQRLALSVDEPPLEADSDTSHPDLRIGFNAYSGSGDVTGEVVYANYGRKEDFERLAALGIECKGKIAIARYGGNYRGFKARFAEQAGAIGLVIYTDPADSGYMRGLMNPEGGWANDAQIQRGSLQTMAYSGDPLTPGIEASEHAERLDPEAVELPRIPVQPVGWAAAAEILERMTGQAVPEESWQGALPFPYRLTGGKDLRVRLMVQQERAITRTANVIGTLRGTRYPDQLVIVGCHHDAWGFGAADPTAGTHVLLESARLFGEAAKRGQRPERTIIFAAWAAEEHGIVGSSEWVEANIDRLENGGIAYFNLDMAAMGPLFGASGSPTLATLIVDATRDVPQCRDPSRTVYSEWTARKGMMDGPVEDPSRLVGTMGGGSDHVGFYFHACVPCASVGGSGSRGTSYHSNYDTLRWYRKVVGEDYEPSLMVMRVLNIAVARLARADVLPLDPRRVAPATLRHLEDLKKQAAAAGLVLDAGRVVESIAMLARQSAAAAESLAGLRAFENASAVNHQLIGLERAWKVESGLPGRPWFVSAYMAPDKDSGYSAWPLPLLREAVDQRDQDGLSRAIIDLAGRIDEIARRVKLAADVAVSGD